MAINKNNKTSTIMKKQFIPLICLFMAMFAITSCSDSNKMKGLLSRIPADATWVVVGNNNLDKVLESARDNYLNVLSAFQ